jgi:ADP-heptose:LPS heptosyltransferase
MKHLKKLILGYKMLNYKNTFTLPFKFQIPTYINHFISNELNLKSKFKYFKRYFYIILKKQQSLEIFKISNTHQKILWINFSAPSIGDSLMDLSSRCFLTGRRVDLITDKKNAHLYQDDKYFSTVFVEKNHVKNQNYDLIIIDSYSSKSIKIKAQIAPDTKFIGMYGYFNGPEVNRVMFSFHRMNCLLDYIKNETEINSKARCSLSISKYDEEVVTQLKLPDDFISIVVGGEWSYRSYNNWLDVIKELCELDNNINIILLGSENGKHDEKTIMNFSSSCNVISYVDQLTYNQSAEIIRRSKLLFCCDGGLMHAANAFLTPIIVLFARLDEKMQLTNSCRALSLYDSSNVNNIGVKYLIEKYNKATNFFDSHRQNE